MQAKLQFVDKIIFNYPINRIAAPVVILTTPNDRNFWSLWFIASEQIGEKSFLGEISWLFDREDNVFFSPGFEFVYISDPGKYEKSNGAEGIFARGQMIE